MPEPSDPFRRRVLAFRVPLFIVSPTGVLSTHAASRSNPESGAVNKVRHVNCPPSETLARLLSGPECGIVAAAL